MLAERAAQVIAQPRSLSPNLANPRAAAAKSVEVRRAKAAARRAERQARRDQASPHAGYSSGPDTPPYPAMRSRPCAANTPKNTLRTVTSGQVRYPTTSSRDNRRQEVISEQEPSRPICPRCNGSVPFQYRLSSARAASGSGHEPRDD